MSHPFGDLLSQYRARKHGLTQARLARLAGYDAPLITKLCQGRKELTGPSGRERVVHLMGVLRDEGALTTLDEANALLQAAGMSPLFDGQPAEAGLMSRLAHARGQTDPPVRRTNLPASLSRFIGRAQEVAEVRQILASTRLLTLTGSGGIGKTRFAQHMAADLVSSFAGGLWYTELAPLTDGKLVAEAVAAAVGMAVGGGTAYEQVIDYLKDRQVLLVLDNCEHLIDAVATFTVDLLRACPRVSILATSREPLNVDGERVWRVPPMQPAEAAQLFMERAHAARSDLTLDIGDATITHICQRLDGMPLAIELAAARLQGMSLSELSARLDDRFALLMGGRRGALPRQQTLQATIDWSYDLLSEPERILFRWLAVFADGWTAELAEQVCAEGLLHASNVLPFLLSLVSKSLVIVEDRDGHTRYHYLETLREYGWQKLIAHGELETLQRRHAEAFAAFAEQSYRPSRGPQQRQWLARLERDFSNLHAALTWSFGPAGDASVGCRIFSDLELLWSAHIFDAQRWARLARAALTGDMPPQLRGGVWLTSTVWYPDESLEQALAGYGQALACYTDAGDWGGVTYASGWIGLWKLRIDPRDPEGWHMLEASAARAHATGDALAEHMFLIHLGVYASVLQEYHRAQGFYQEAIHSCRETSDVFHLSQASLNLAINQLQQLQFHDALGNIQQAADAARQVNNYGCILLAECYTADIIRYCGDALRAVALGETNLVFARDKFPPTSTLHMVPVHALAKALNDTGQYDRAQALLVGWVKGFSQTEAVNNYGQWGGHSLDILACVAVGRGDAERAARLFGLADKAIAMFGLRRYPHNIREYAPYIAKAREALGDEAYEAARAGGCAMTPEQAVAYALQGSQAEAESP